MFKMRPGIWSVLSRMARKYDKGYREFRILEPSMMAVSLSNAFKFEDYIRLSVNNR